VQLHTSDPCKSTCAITKNSLTTSLFYSFYYDGFSRNPYRWLVNGPQASEPLCLYSLKVPIGKPDVGNSAAELVLNVVKSETEEEMWDVDALRKKLFPGR
jgi:hypothetical protein